MLGIIVLTVVWNSRNFDGFFGLPGILTDFLGIPGSLTVVWNSRNFDGFFGIPGNLTDFLEFPEFWRLFGTPGILTASLEFLEFWQIFWNSWNFDGCLEFPEFWLIFLRLLLPPGPEGVPGVAPCFKQGSKLALECPHIPDTLATASVSVLSDRQPLTWGFSFPLVYQAWNQK